MTIAALQLQADICPFHAPHESRGPQASLSNMSKDFLGMNTNQFSFLKGSASVTRMDEHCLAGVVDSFSSHYPECIPCKDKERTSATRPATQPPSKRTTQARKTCLPGILTKVMGVLLSLKLKEDEERKRPCTQAARAVYCTWDAEWPQVQLLPWLTAWCSIWPNQKDDYRTVQTTAKTLFSLANHLERKVVAMRIRQVEVEVAIPCTLAPLLPAGKHLPSAGCGAMSWTLPAHLPQASTVSEINLENFASFALARPGKRSVRGSRVYFLWKTPGTGKPWSECLQTPRKVLAQELRRVSMYSELWVIMLKFC